MPVLDKENSSMSIIQDIVSFQNNNITVTEI
jgi:hypothetical protein